MPNVCLLPDKDTCINQYDYDVNYGTNAQIWMDCIYVAGSKTQQMRALMHWTIPAEVNTAEVYKGILCLGYVAAPFGSVTGTINRITQAWTEAGATWIKYDGTNAWVLAGGDYADPHVHVTWPAADVGWFEIDITELVTDAITNRSRSLDLLFRLDDEIPLTSIQFYWRSKTQTGTYVLFRPFLNIVRPPFGTPMEV